MNEPITFTTPSGDRMVVIPAAEYERLAEIAETVADLRAYDQAKARLSAGEDELIPAEVANRILAGENKVRVWREYRGLDGEGLAERADISAAHLSQIETDKREGTVAALKKIAAALRVGIDDLV